MDQEETAALDSIDKIIAAALALGADQVPGWSCAEKELAKVTPPAQVDVADLEERIRAGHDPLGEAYCQVRNAEQRRPLGQTYTPEIVVASMIEWAANEGMPQRIIDPGTGSGRYLSAAARKFPDAELLGADVDPIAGLMARGTLAAAGLAHRAHITLTDFRSLPHDPRPGRTLYVGNPPYVRHHQIDPEWKAWLTATAKKRGIVASQLAGLHAHFFLAAAEHGQPGDYGAFITSAEWLDVNYGKLIRELLLDGLGGTAIHVLEPTAEVFTDATTTGSITCFHLGSKPTSVKVRRVKTVEQLGDLSGGRLVSRQRLAGANRWSVLTRVTPKIPDGYIELGEIARVHRGAVTGANDMWVRHRSAVKLPDRVLFASITKAHELFSAGARLSDASQLRVVVDIPADLDVLESDERKLVDKFLRTAKAAGGDEGYVVENRKAWWSVGLRAAAPILATYMARRPPAFVQNEAAARHINIAHGIYPRVPMTPEAIDRLATHLRVSVNVGQGRTYAGGLTKFEPKEMERLPVPNPELLTAGV